MDNITEKTIAEAKKCKTEEELKALAKENGIEISDEEIKLFLAEKAEGELADEELEAVSGGQKGCKRNAHEKVYFPSEAEVQYLFDIGDVAQAFIGKFIGNETATVKITGRKPFHAILDEGRWYDSYKYERISGSPGHLCLDWQDRDRFQK